MRKQCLGSGERTHCSWVDFLEEERRMIRHPPFSLLPNTSPMFTPSPSSASHPVRACRCSPWSCSPCGPRSSSRSDNAKSGGFDFRRLHVFALRTMMILDYTPRVLYVSTPIYYLPFFLWIGLLGCIFKAGRLRRAGHRCGRG